MAMLSRMVASRPRAVARSATRAAAASVRVDTKRLAMRRAQRLDYRVEPPQDDALGRRAQAGRRTAFGRLPVWRSGRARIGAALRRRLAAGSLRSGASAWFRHGRVRSPWREAARALHSRRGRGQVRRRGGDELPPRLVHKPFSGTGPSCEHDELDARLVGGDRHRPQLAGWRPEPPNDNRLACLSESETREAIQVRKTIPPFRAVEAALRAEAGESVSIRMCRNESAMVVRRRRPAARQPARAYPGRRGHRQRGPGPTGALTPTYTFPEGALGAPAGRRRR